jgi:hypothetical protein
MSDESTTTEESSTEEPVLTESQTRRRQYVLDGVALGTYPHRLIEKRPISG